MSSLIANRFADSGGLVRGSRREHVPERGDQRVAPAREALFANRRKIGAIERPCARGTGEQEKRHVSVKPRERSRPQGLSLCIEEAPEQLVVLRVVVAGVRFQQVLRVLVDSGARTGLGDAAQSTLKEVKPATCLSGRRVTLPATSCDGQPSLLAGDARLRPASRNVLGPRGPSCR